MPKIRRKRYPDIWVALWSDVSVVRDGRERQEHMGTFTVARDGREATAIMADGLLGFSDVTGALTKPRVVRRASSLGFSEKPTDAVGELMAKNYRFIFPERNASFEQVRDIAETLMVMSFLA